MRRKGRGGEGGCWFDLLAGVLEVRWRDLHLLIPTVNLLRMSNRYREPDHLRKQLKLKNIVNS